MLSIRTFTKWLYSEAHTTKTNEENGGLEGKEENTFYLTNRTE